MAVMMSDGNVTRCASENSYFSAQDLVIAQLNNEQLCCISENFQCTKGMQS